MKTLVSHIFAKDVKRVRDASLQKRVGNMVEQVQAANSIMEIAQARSLQGHSDSFRIRIGEYRIGLYIENGIVVFARFLHRKEIYRYFP